jgi:hypothetical protein
MENVWNFATIATCLAVMGTLLAVCLQSGGLRTEIVVCCSYAAYLAAAGLISTGTMIKKSLLNKHLRYQSQTQVQEQRLNPQQRKLNRR